MQRKMKALVKGKSEPGLHMMSVLVPEIGPADLLVKVTRTAICGTDLHIYKWDEWARATIPVPMVIGHEFCGKIVAVGGNVTRYEPGQRVTAEGHIVCGGCRNCRAGRGHLCRNTRGIGVDRSGAFAEYIAIPESNAILIPGDIDDETAALLDPLGNAVHTALSFNCVGEDVLVTGAGPIGIMGAMVAQFTGARKVVISDINPRRLAMARIAGIRHCFEAGKGDLSRYMRRIKMKEGFDVGLEMSGAPDALRDMIANMNNGGKIAILGIPPEGFAIDWNPVIFKMLHLKGIYGREMFDGWYKTIALVQGGVDPKSLITHRIDAEKFEEGFALMMAGEAGKVVMCW